MLRLPSSDINSSRPKTRVSALRAGDLQSWLEGTLRQWSGTTVCRAKLGLPGVESLLAQTPGGRRRSRVWGELQCSSAAGG